ncbi:hypothetical protein GCM10022206_52330 [Streptomyces chiangmaiensis]
MGGPGTARSTDPVRPWLPRAGRAGGGQALGGDRCHRGRVRPRLVLIGEDQTGRRLAWQRELEIPTQPEGENPLPSASGRGAVNVVRSRRGEASTLNPA